MCSRPSALFSVNFLGFPFEKSYETWLTGDEDPVSGIMRERGALVGSMNSTSAVCCAFAFAGKNPSAADRIPVYMAVLRIFL